MVFDDLKQMEGQIIDYYEVKGNSIKAKKGKIKKGEFYHNELKLVDKLGRCQEHTYHIIYCGYVKLFLDKEEAYNYVIENLRKQRQNINKKMLKIQMELYGKKTEIKNEG